MPLYMFDVDGTLRWTTVPGQKYPLRSDEWRLMPNVAETLARIWLAGPAPMIGICSNQSGVGEGQLSRGLAKKLILDTVLAAFGHMPDAIEIEMCICPEAKPCTRRKPQPGLLLAILHRFRVSPGDALYIGDLSIDAEAALAAGVRFIPAKDFFASREGCARLRR
jgi:D-glycero-D-manno-heptose 1,7-bisphosphate phosphatase